MGYMEKRRKTELKNRGDSSADKIDLYWGVMVMYLFAEVIFYANRCKHLPVNGYRPDAIFNGSEDYWGITFTDLTIKGFDAPTPATIRFSFREIHYQEVVPGQSFRIMEGPHQVGEGTILSIEG